MNDTQPSTSASAPRSSFLPRTAMVAGAGYLLAFGLSLGPKAAEPVVAIQDGAAAKSALDGVYTAEQAARGAKTFEARCSFCHQPAQFVGPVFMSMWSNQPAQSLFQFVRTTMPEDSPGSLKREEYADIIAYIFKLNGLPTGATELGSTDSALKQVRIEAPKK